MDGCLQVANTQELIYIKLYAIKDDSKKDHKTLGIILCIPLSKAFMVGIFRVPSRKNMVHCQKQSLGTGNSGKTSPHGQVSDVLNGLLVPNPNPNPNHF